MAIHTGEFWTISDNIDDMEADQPYAVTSMIEYGQAALDTSTLDKSDDLQFGYGRGILIHAPCSELAADNRQYKLNNNKMEEILTTDDIVKLNKHDADKLDVRETADMLRSVGINKYDDAKFTSYRSKENNKILSKPIVYLKGFPILLDDSFFKFQLKPKVKAIDLDNTTNGTMKDGTMLNNNNLVISDNQNGENSSSDGASTYIGFAKKHTLRYKQPTVGIGRAIFVKPIDVYFSQKTKQSMKKKLSKAN